MAIINRSLGLVLLFVLQIWLSRLVGPEGMGVYALYTTWMTLIAIVAEAGTGPYIQRTVSVLFDRGKKSSARYFVLRILVMTTMLASLIVALVWFLPQSFYDQLLGDSLYNQLMLLSAVAAVFMILIKLLALSFTGLDQVNASINGEKTLPPLLALLALAGYWVLEVDLQIETYLYLHIVISALVSAFLLLQFYRFTRHENHTDETRSVPPMLDKSLWAFWLTGLLTVWFTNMPVVLLPQFASTEEIGIFVVAFRIVALGTIVMMTLSSFFSPKFARAYADQDVARLRRLLRQSQLFGALFFLPILLICVFAAEPLLGLFGPEFVAGQALLWIMITGQFIQTISGLVAYMMNMMHREKAVLFIFVIMTLIVFTLIFILGEAMGVVGVALAFSIGMALKGLLSMILAQFYLKSFERELKPL